jgi:5'-methylthioadenosine phosphorylase
MKIGIIGGSGFRSFPAVTTVTENTIQTPYGSATIETIQFLDEQLYFLPRHGKQHHIPPHQINYRANLCALHQVGVTHILATAACGSLQKNLAPGMFGTCSSYLEFTKNRKHTFYDHFVPAVSHIDQTQPYSSFLNNHIVNSFEEIPVSYQSNLTMVVTEGPRYETAAEIKMFSMFGGDIVNMTGYPEVVLAGEMEMEYACIGIVTNYAAGISPTPLTMEEVELQMKKSNQHLFEIFQQTIPRILHDNQ